MPAVRAETARRLVRQGLAQDRIAEHLGVSQAMVSKYLRKPAPEAVASPELLEQLVKGSVAIATSDEGSGRVGPWCPVCITMSKQGLSLATSAALEMSQCLRHDSPREDGGAAAILQELAAAEARLRRIDFAPLVPQVRSNLAAALSDARNTRDVAGFPGRLVEIRGRLQAAAAPEFGSSTHLAQVLIRIRRVQPEMRAILNTRYNDAIRRAARDAGLKVRVVKRARGELVFNLPPQPVLDAVADAGAFGVEPALYLLGRSPSEVVQKAARLAAQLPKAVAE